MRTLLLFAVLACVCSVARASDLTAITDKTFFDVEIDGKLEGRIVMGLYGNAVPKTVDNFRSLCECTREGLCYKGTPFHRIIPNFMVQGGDITHGNGMGGKSIYGDKFDDEAFPLELRHRGEGILSMANSGKNSNSSQFFITLVDTAWLDGKHVIFGKVLEGLDILKRMESKGSQSGKTTFSRLDRKREAPQ